MFRDGGGEDSTVVVDDDRTCAAGADVNAEDGNTLLYDVSGTRFQVPGTRGISADSGDSKRA